MSVLEQERVGAANGSAGVSAEIPARIVLQPIAAPSVLGLYGFAGATLIVAGWMAGWYGSRLTPEFIFPFAALFGGLAQFLAGMWAYRARDVLATAVHGTWGTFWMGYGVLYALFATGTLVQPRDAFPGLAMWFVALAAITAVGALAALAESGVLFGFLVTLTTGSVVAAIAYFTGSASVLTAAGWVLVVAAVLAWYTASAMLLAAAHGRVVLPLGRYTREANIPGSRLLRVIEDARGEPGVRRGQ